MQHAGEPYIEYLAHHKEAIPVLAEWYYTEWSFLYPDKTVQGFRQMIGRRARTDCLPLALLAYCGDELVGTVSLKTQDMHSSRRLSPWLTSLYVRQDHRERGIGRLLVDAVCKKAYDLGRQSVHLFTVGLEPYYERQGWQIIEQTRYGIYTVSTMRKVVGPL